MRRKINVKHCDTIIFSIYLTKLTISLILSKSEITTLVSLKKRGLFRDIFTEPGGSMKFYG